MDFRLQAGSKRVSRESPCGLAPWVIIIYLFIYFFGRLVRSEFNPLCYCFSVIPLCSSGGGGEVLCVHADRGGVQHAGVDRSHWNITSPQDWTPCCWGCRVTAMTAKSHHCPRRCPKSPTQRRTPLHRGKGQVSKSNTHPHKYIFIQI